MAYKDLGKRLIVAGIGAPAILALSWYGRWPFFLLVTAIILLATHEFLGLLKQKSLTPPVALVLAAAAVLPLLVFSGAFTYILPFSVLLLSLLLIREMMQSKSHALLPAAAGFFTYAYVGGLLSFMIALRELPWQVQLPYRRGGEWVILLLVAIWICDSAAYFAGSRFGKHKLAPTISPNKTIEGAVGGVVASVLTMLAGQAIFPDGLSRLDGIVIGLIVGIFGQLSDLIESMLKRDAGVKDTSTLLPGHGGVLDRFDSEMLVTPAVFFYLLLTRGG